MKTFFTTYKNPITVLILLVVFGGMMAYNNLQTALFPEITFPKIKIIADAGQQPVGQMMLSVTRTLEGAVKKVPDLKMIHSTTSRGSCEISAYMDWKADIDISQQRIESKINEVRNELPPGIHISVERMNPSILPVIGYSLDAPGLSPIDQKLLAQYTIKPFLSQVEGVSEVRVIGGKAKEYQVALNQQKMSTLGVTPEMISNALSQTNFIKSNGYLSEYRYMYLSVTDAIVNSKDKLENLVIRNDGKRIVLLKDLAKVQIQDAKEYVKINDGGKESLLLAVIKQPNANLTELSVKMQKKVEDLHKILPHGVSLKPYYVQADFVKSSVHSVVDCIWIGLLLAIIVVIIFLRSVKASAVILLTIPLTLLLTLIVLYATGQALNIMTLGAIAAAIGLIIDDAIVVVEQIHRTHEENPGEPTNILVQRAIHYLFPAMLGSSLSTIVIFLPFVLMSGVAGAYFKVMTNTMIIILVCSFFVTWIMLPVIYMFLTKNFKQRVQHTLPASHEVKKQQWVSFFIKRPVISICFVLALITSVIFIIPRIETGFLPEMDEGSIVMDYSSPSGTSLEETDRILRNVETIITKIPEVETYSRRTGTQMGFFITEPNRGDYLIQLKKNRKRTTDEVIDEIRTKIESTQPALRIDFGQVIGDMLGDLMSSVQPVEVKVFGPDPQVIQKVSKQVAAEIGKVSGTADVFDGIVIAGPSVSIAPDFTMLARYGITPANLQYQLQLSLEGNTAGTVQDKEQFSDIRLVYPGNRKQNLEDVRQLQLFLPDGHLIPLSSIAKIKINTGDAEIEREDLQSVGVVTSRLNNRDLGSVMKDIQKEVTEKVSLPQGYSIVYAGDYANQQQSFHELLIILIVASLLVFCVILFLFKDFRVATIILFVAMLGISGSYLGLFSTNTPLNVGSYTGLIMIVGIIGENAIFTFLQFREFYRETQDLDQSIVFAISTRLRPKLMTAVSTIIALMPIALGVGTGAQMHQPLAIAVIGGFLIAMPLLLIVLPTLIRIIYRNHRGPE